MPHDSFISFTPTFDHHSSSVSYDPTPSYGHHSSSTSYDSTPSYGHHSSGTSHDSTPSYGHHSSSNSNDSMPSHGHHSSNTNDSYHVEPSYQQTATSEHYHHRKNKRDDDDNFYLTQQMMMQPFYNTSTASSSPSVTGNSTSAARAERRITKLLPKPLIRESIIYKKFAQFILENKSENKEYNDALTALKNHIEAVCQDVENGSLSYKLANDIIEKDFNDFEIFKNNIDYYKKQILNFQDMRDVTLVIDLEAKAYKGYASSFDPAKELKEMQDLYHHCCVASIKNKIVNTDWKVGFFQSKREITIDKNQPNKMVPRKVGTIWDEINKANQGKITWLEANSNIHVIAGLAVQQSRWSDERTEQYRTLCNMSGSHG